MWGSNLSSISAFSSTSTLTSGAQQLQLRVLRFGLLQDGGRDRHPSRA
jgi:hypothetical protein